MSHPVPTLATSPDAQTSEVVTAFGTIVGYVDDAETLTNDVKAALLAWVTAVQDALLLRIAASPYNDANASTKNAALVAAFDALKAALI